jgi:glycosyltransferase involved in cell wall biosynthesis
MKILHVVALIQASTGGPAVSVTRLAAEQAKMGHEVTLACLDYPHLGPRVAAPGVRVVSVKGNIFAVRGRGWCPEFRRVLREEAEKADVVHNHGLWMWPNAYAREAAVAAGKPLIISPRGMLEAWSLGRSKLRKAVAWRLFEKRNLQAAAMFHATADAEKRSIEKAISHGLARIKGRISPGGCADRSGGECSSPGIALGPSAVPGFRDASSKEDHLRLTDLRLKTTTGVPVVVAPNGVDLPDLARRPGREVLEEMFPELRDRRWVVFMSRLHPKKGVDVLLHAWARQKEVTGTEALRDGPKATEWRVKSSQTETPLYRNTQAPHRGAVLVLAGSDLIGYRKDIERMIKELGLGDSVVITGEVAGEEKDCLLANADVFVLPSYSENFGIVVAEAMAWGHPVIASTGTPWKEIADVGAGWWVKPEEDALAQALYEALGTRQEELEAMGAKGRALVERSYTWSAPAERLTKAYEQTLATADRRETDNVKS